jgi:RNA polymerase sigma-70 factor (ECF subfamily)
MSEGDNDEDLMRRVATSDNRAFRVLMARHIGRVIRVAQTTVGSAAEADDIAQEAFIRVWKNAVSFDPMQGRFTTWLHRIVMNLAIDRLRKPRGEALESAGDVATDEPGALGMLIAREEQRSMAEALAALPERQRAAIALFYFEGLSGRESAQALDIGEKAFESLLLRARAALKQRVLANAK